MSPTPQQARDFYASIERDIARVGRKVVGVLGDPPFAYTIGNHRLGKPELLLIGLNPSDAMWFLNRISELIATFTRPVAGGEILHLGGKYGLKAIHAGARARAEYTLQIGRYFGAEDYALIQLLAPDQSGRYPPDPLCAPPYSTCPVLGVEA